MFLAEGQIVTLKLLCIPCLTRLLAFILKNVYLLFGKALVMDFFSFFTQYFRLQIVFLEQSRLASGLRRKLSSFPKVFRYYQKCKV